jgi:hypothetical protein
MAYQYVLSTANLCEAYTDFLNQRSVPVFRTELWNFLRSLLSELKDLDRIVVTGASRGKAMERRLPWSPVHFVGGDDVGTHDLLSRMNNCVAKNSGQNVVKWLRKNGKLQLEVLSMPSLRESVDARWTQASEMEDRTEVWPPNGTCSFSACERHSYGTEPMDKELSPNAV